METDASRNVPATRSGVRRLGGGAAPAENPFAVLAYVLLLTGAAGAVFLAAGVPQGSPGIFLVCAGAALILCPPGAKVDARLWVGAGALIASASLAFLPAHWFRVPAWRKTLEGLPVIPLPATITPAPWQSAFWLALLAFTVLTGLFMLAQPIRSRTLLALASAASLVCGIYAALAIYAKATGWHYPFNEDASFGFFPNRNHTATFLITGSILAIGILGVTLREGRWMTAGAAAGALTVCVASLFFYSASRGGVVFLAAGAVLWVAGLGRAFRRGPLLISVGALLLAAGTLFVLSGSVAQTRIAALWHHSPGQTASRAVAIPGETAAAGQPPSAGGDTPFDLRILIYEDTLPLIRDFPFTGTGLGTFAMVFPQYRNLSLSEVPAVHPESDWLMLAAEAGIPAFVGAVTLIWLVTRQLRAFREHPYWPLRWGCVAAAAAAVLHGMVDVPAHHVSLGWWILVIAGLGLQPGRQQPAERSRWQQAVFVLGGLAMLLLGVALIRAEWFGATPLPPFATQRAQSDIARAFTQHDVDGATRIARQAIFGSPMAEALYFERGALELPFADSDAEVDAAFKAERLLEPGSSTIPLRQGEAWLHYDAARASALWLDALSRRQRIDRVPGSRAEASLGFYRDLLGRAAKWPDVQRELMEAGVDHPAFALAWLEDARPELVADQLERWANDAGFLEHLNAGERRRFLLAWYAKGDREKLAQFVDGHKDWREVAWPVRLRQWVDGQEFERAVHEAAHHYQISLALPAPGQPGELVGTPEQEQADPVAASNAYWREGNSIAARRVLDEATGNGSGHPVPPEVWRMKAAAAAQGLDWAAAWQDLRKYILAQRPGEAL